MLLPHLLSLRLLLVAAVLALGIVSLSSAFSLTTYYDGQCQSTFPLYNVSLPSLPTAYVNTTDPICYNTSTLTSSAVQSVLYSCTSTGMMAYLFTQLGCQYQFVQLGNTSMVTGLLWAIESAKVPNVTESVCSQVSVTLPNSTDTMMWGVYTCSSSAEYRRVPILSALLFAFVFACVTSW